MLPIDRAMGRRHLLQLAGAAALAGAPAGLARAAGQAQIRTVANGGTENETTNALMDRQGFFKAVGLTQQLVKVNAPQATLQALVSDQADVSITSGFNGFLPAIEKGAPVKVIGAAVQRPTLAVYSAHPEIRKVADLVGRTVGIGPATGVLMVTMTALLKRKGIDSAKVKFVSIGSNEEVYRKVKAGEVDAGPSDVINVLDTDASRPHMLADAQMWLELPDYPYQLSFASDRAIRDNRDGVVRVLAAYGRMYRFLSSRASWPGYLAARKAAGADEASAKVAWDYMQREHPYAGSPQTSAKKLQYLQTLHVSVGLQKKVLPVTAVADLTLARDALKRM